MANKFAIFFICVFGLTIALSSCKKTIEQDLSKDLDFIHQAIIDNHPGVYNKLDPDFNSHLEREYKKAKELFDKKPSLSEQKQIITNFLKSFNDNHLTVTWLENTKIIKTGKFVLPKDFPQQKTTQLFEKKSESNYTSIENLNSDIAWIKIKTFGLFGDQKDNFKKILEQVPALRCKKAIVFDIRGNGGGNSGHGQNLIESFFGQEYAEQKIDKYFEKTFGDYRASVDNLAWAKTREDEAQDTIAGITNCISKNIPYYKSSISEYKTHKPLDKKTSAKIFAIIDSKNASAALDFLDYLKAVDPKVTLIGEKTGTDRLYMDCALMHLPSECGIFCYPIKVYRNRPRGDAQPYYPDIEFDTKDTEKLKKYIIDIVK